MFCDIDLNTVEGREEYIRTIGQIVDWAYKAAEEEKKK
jgi:hypothetical protein